MTKPKPSVALYVFNSALLKHDVELEVVCRDTTVERFYLSLGLSPSLHTKLAYGRVPSGLAIALLCLRTGKPVTRYLRPRPPKTTVPKSPIAALAGRLRG
jgi:hypothetical protein